MAADNAPLNVDRYEIQSELRRGGQSTVYIAYDPRFKREVAVKLLPLEFMHDATFHERFAREAQTLARLEHSAIVPVYDFGEWNGQPYLVMRLMTSENLSDRIAMGAMPTSEASKVISRIAPALDKAHSQGIIHRDIKPGNILFDQDGKAYISDFGTVKFAESAVTVITVTGTTLGTPAYMSPEQARAIEDLDGKSDIYSLGIVLFEMLTGNLPYNADTPMGLAMMHVLEPVPRILEAKRDLNPAFEPIVSKALAKDREVRYSNATDLAKAVESVAPDHIPESPAVMKTEFGPPDFVYDHDTTILKSRRKIPAWLFATFGILIFIAATLFIMNAAGIFSGESNNETITAETISVEQITQPEYIEVTRVVDFSQEVEVTHVVEVIEEVEVTRLVEVEVPVGPVEKAVVEFWTTDSSEDRVAAYEAVANEFMVANPDIDIKIVPVEEANLFKRIRTALTQNRLPDLVRMSDEQAAVLVVDGFLDEDAAEAVIASVGEDDFRAGPLAMITDPVTGKYAAVPFEGWIQGIFYREDIFNEAGLSAPVTWEDILAACRSLPGIGNLQYAVTLPTNPAPDYGHQVFEQVAMSNNAWPFNKEGNVTMNTPEMIAALDFFTSLQDCALPGPQYWRGAREAYELGQTGMLFYSSWIMDDLVVGSELEGGGNVEIAVEALAINTGFAPEMVGPNGSASYGVLNVLGLMKDASPASQRVARYFLTEGYQDVLALVPFGYIPVLKSAVEEWKGRNELFASYTDETLDQIPKGFEMMGRWQFGPDYDASQKAVISDIEDQRLIQTAIYNIAIERTMTPETAAAWLQEQVDALAAESEEG